MQVDFLLTAMRQLAAERPDLKLVLMSATVNAQKLVDYFAEAVSGEQVDTVASLHTALDCTDGKVQQHDLVLQGRM